jgi:hypothetical protein
MLRSVVVGLGALAAITGAALLLAGGPLPIAIWLLAVGLMVTVGIVYERVRYKSLARKRPGPGWQRTAERFVDPESGKMVTVYFRSSDGERMYVEE